MPDLTFGEYVAAMPGLYKTLIESEAIPIMSSGRFSAIHAIYAFYENGEAKHVGRTRNLKRRLMGHRANSHYSASFAFAETRVALNMPARNRKGEGRGYLVTLPDVATEFARQRQRVAAMDVRFVQVDGSICQHMLELYAAMHLGTPLTGFNTH